jgi:unsaturated rhamnogalacturonyl hydrolase
MCTPIRGALVLAALSVHPTTGVAQSTPSSSHIASEIARLVRGPQEHRLGPIGLTASGRGIAALEPSLPAMATQPRVVIVGGLDGASEGARAVLDLVAWRLASETAARNRRRWQLAAVPCALPDRCDIAAAPEPGAAPSPSAVPSFPPANGYFDAPVHREARYVWRWVTMLAADLVIDVREGPTIEWRANALARGRTAGDADATPDSFAGALGAALPGGVAAVQVSGPRADVVKAVREFLEVKAIASPSPLGRALTTRQLRSPLQIARLLAGRYPASPIMSYIPALAWSGALQVSALTGDPQYRDRALAQMHPFLAGERPAITEPSLLTSLAGHQAFFDLAETGGTAQADALARKAADHILGLAPDEIVRFATSWTDDMFMATSVLARAAKRTADARYADAVARLLTTYITRLQRPDRLFVHAESGPHAWGRGNGFAAFGLMEALTHLPSTWSARPAVLDSFRRLMDGMRRHQEPDGTWHQVVDEPGTYREFTVTAMTVAAMARGVRLGWLDQTFADVVDRGWRAVQMRVTESGDLVDVCSGTGAGRNATRDYYLDRPAITGPDDRGGAMALTAALDVHALRAVAK